MSTSSQTPEPLSPERLAEIREAAVQAVKDHPSTTFMAPYESLADAVLAVVQPPLLAEIERLTARVAELEGNAQKLVDGWRQASGDHEKFAQSKVMAEMPGMADKQEGRSLQLQDCADELADVLRGENPDEWEHGIGVDVLDRDERTEAGAR